MKGMKDVKNMQIKILEMKNDTVILDQMLQKKDGRTCSQGDRNYQKEMERKKTTKVRAPVNCVTQP